MNHRLLIILASLLLVIDISIDTFNNIPFQTQNSYLRVQFWVCIFFLVELLYEFIISKNKTNYIKTHLLFIFISIPYLNIINYFNITLSEDLKIFLRLIPLIRGGYAFYLLVGWFCKNKAKSLFISYLTILLACIYFSSLIFYTVEHTVNKSVHSYGDAFWWAWMNVTTVGSNIFAITTIGKIISVILPILGMLMFPIFTVYITSIVQKSNHNSHKNLD
ncbi:potassium channel family protein [Chishuiella sp.]|uniref:potassium channel family protein n=1 Tax=Chishuiella sp. TaxID=1969467 RepID=UPI0028A5CF6D|nr:potassium channel family protein [Chishuiella sp.]